MEVVWSYFESFCIVDMEDIFQMVSAAVFWKIFFSSCRCIKPQLKSLALGFHALATRTLGKSPSKHVQHVQVADQSDKIQRFCLSFCLYVCNSWFVSACCVSVLGGCGSGYKFGVYVFWSTAGIPAPIYFGAIIDTTCLKWGQKRCGGIGACRIYNTTAYR